MSYILDYNERLTMRFPAEETNSLVSGGFFKLSLKRYTAFVDDGLISFKTSLTYIDYKKIIEIVLRKYPDTVVSDRLAEHIRTREMHVEKRYLMGNEIKQRDSKFSQQFEQYKQVVDGAMSRKLRDKQMWDSFFMCTMKKSSNFSVPGSGKTASVLGVYAYLKSRNIVNKLIIVSPKNAFGSWIDEFEACFNGKEKLNYLNIHDSSYKNTVAKRNALLYESGNCNLILTNYEAIGGIKDALNELVKDKALLVFDEVHKVKRVDGEYASHSLEIAQNASYVIAMTGTPVPNSYLDVYNLLHILFPDEYDSFFNFSIPMLKRPSANDVNEINDKIQPFFCRTTKNQLGVPPANLDSIQSVTSSDTENRILEILKMKYRRNKLGLLIRIMQLESNPRMLLSNLNLSDFRYLLDDTVDTNEIDYADYSQEITKLLNNAEKSTKFNRCVDLACSLIQQNKTAIIWCVFVDSINSLAKALEEKGIKTCCIYGEVPLEDRLKMIQDFRDGNIQILLTNPHTLAESVSLHSVCHDAIYYEYSYNLVHLLQSKDRIHRLGLPDDQYTQYYFMQVNYETEDGSWSMDNAVYQRLKEKEQIMLDAIDNHILETMPTSQEDLDLIFSEFF